MSNLIGAVFAVLAVTYWDVVGAATPVVCLVLSAIFNIAVLRSYRAVLHERKNAMMEWVDIVLMRD